MNCYSQTCGGHVKVNTQILHLIVVTDQLLQPNMELLPLIAVPEEVL
jgi:hypothetical protein